MPEDSVSPDRPPAPLAEGDVPLDREVIKVLASDTRLDILRLLRTRRMTLTEISKALDLKKATILEHLERLTGAGLVQRKEDERLWVYYELTRRGGHVVNPGRARFVLIVGTALGAALVGMALVLAFQHFAGVAPELPPPTPAAPGAMRFELQEREAWAGGPVSLHGLVQDSSGNGTPAASAYLLRADQAQALQVGAPTEGTPLTLSSEGFIAELRSQTGVPPGTYFVYVRDAAGRDNLASLPQIRVAAVSLNLSASVWWRGLDGPVLAQVARDGTPLNGTLEFSATDSAGANTTVEVRRGSATIPASVLDVSAPGRYALRFLPRGAVDWLALDGAMEIRDPAIALYPRTVASGSPSNLTLDVTAGPRAASTMDVRVTGPAESPTPLTDTRWRIPVNPSAPGRVEVQVGRLSRLGVEVVPDVRVAFTALPAQQHELRLENPRNGTAAAGVGVRLDGAPLGFTNSTGELTFPAPAQGLHNLVLLLPEEGAVSRRLFVSGATVSEASSDVLLAPSQAPATTPGTVSVEARVRNLRATGESLTLIGSLDGKPLAAEALSVPGQGNASTLLRVHAPDPGQHLLEIRAEPVARSPLQFTDRRQPPAPTPTSPSPTGGSPASPTSAPSAPSTSPGDFSSTAPMTPSGSFYYDAYGHPTPPTATLTVHVAPLPDVTPDDLNSDGRNVILEPARPAHGVEEKHSARAAPGLDAPLLLAAAALALAVASGRRKKPA